MQELKGTGVALVTPFNDDYSVDYNGLANVVEYNIENGVDYLVVMGTTAENATLTQAEKQQVIDHVVAVNAGRLPVVIGIGGNNTHNLIKEIKEQNLKYFVAILSVSPYYNKPTQEGIYAHYAALASASDVPLVLYNVPGRTGSNVLPETAFRLASAFKNIIGIKEAAGSMVQNLQLLQGRPDGFMVISGDDMLALPLISAGGEGVISVIGQGIPAFFTHMINEGLSGNIKEAFAKHYTMMPGIDLIFEEGNPAGIKALLAQKGICKDTVRLPLVKASATLNTKIATFLNTI